MKVTILLFKFSPSFKGKNSSIKNKKNKKCNYCKQYNHSLKNCFLLRHKNIVKNCKKLNLDENNYQRHALKKKVWQCSRRMFLFCCQKAHKRIHRDYSPSTDWDCLIFEVDHEAVVPSSTASQKSSSTIQPNKLKNPGLRILKEILKTIKFDENLIAINNEILGRFLSSFIEEMKQQDKLFKTLYQKNAYTGSFYSDLRISEPDEFDINLVLKMPFEKDDIEINYPPQVPSYAEFHLKKNEAAMAVTHPTLVRELFKDGYLMPEEVRKWIQSVVDKAPQTYQLPHGITRIIPSSSGPARTVKLVKQRGIIDIDLVPVISWDMDTKQPGIVERTFLVPKPYSLSGLATANGNEFPRLWRTHFPDAEKDLMHDLGCVKPVIKLLKLLRDKENWKILASYYLTTVVMWMILENSDETYWKEDKLYLRLIEALKRLAAFVKDRKIPYFFNTEYNLIEKMNESQAFNLCNRITALVKSVEKDRTKLWDMFRVPRTF